MALFRVIVDVAALVLLGYTFGEVYVGVYRRHWTLARVALAGYRAALFILLLLFLSVEFKLYLGINSFHREAMILLIPALITLFSSFLDLAALRLKRPTGA